MPARLSHDLPPLSVQSGCIVDGGTGNRITLRGINLSGLQYSGPSNALENAGVTPADIDQITTGWNARVVRLPFNQRWALAPDDEDPEEYDCPYLQAIDSVIEKAASNGAYTLLNLHRLDERVRGVDNHGQANYVPPLPNLDSIRLWRQLARRYRDEPAVLYDIFNEPHTPLPGDPVPLLGIREDGSTFPLPAGVVGMAEWQPWARQLIQAVISADPAALLFVSGVDWGFDLTGFPIPEQSQVVYSTHVYRWKGDPASIRAAEFGRLAQEGLAVFAAEWGGADADVAWGNDVADYFDELQIGWTAWSWNNKPFLVDSPPYNPTAFGCLVRTRLSQAPT